MAKGYARIDLSEEEIAYLEEIQNNADKFKGEFDYKKYEYPATKKHLFGLIKVKTKEFSWDKAISDCPEGCAIESWFSDNPYCVVLYPYNGPVEKILSIANSGSTECYYDHNLCEVINRYARL